MELYTISMSQWRKAKAKDIEIFDITYKSGDKRLAPENSLLWPYKRGEVSDEEYTRVYLNKLRDVAREDPGAFKQILDSGTPLALACFCPAGKFCHRHLLKDFILHIAKCNNLSVDYKGEIV